MLLGKGKFGCQLGIKMSCLKQNGQTLHLTMFTDCLKKLILEKSLESFVPKKLSTYLLETIEDVKMQYIADIEPAKLVFMVA